jgi:hypothetical protein
VHQAAVVACVLAGPPGRKPRKEVRTFGTMTRDLEALRGWLAAEGVTHVAMESTGVYWKPVYAILEGHKLEPLALALEGRFGEHHRYLLALHLRRLEAMQAELAELEARIEERVQTFQHQRDRLLQIPGIDRSIASSILAEIGVDMAVFGTAKRLAAWAGVCPANHESAGRRKGTTTRKGNVHLKTALVNAAMSAIKQKGSYYKAKYYRLKARRGAKRAAMAIAHKLLVAAFHMLSSDIPFRELGETFLDQHAKRRITAGLLRRLNALGYEVMLIPAAGSLDLWRRPASWLGRGSELGAGPWSPCRSRRGGRPRSCARWRAASGTGGSARACWRSPTPWTG